MNLEDLSTFQFTIRAELQQGKHWPDIVEWLRNEGLDTLDIQLVLRSMQAWRENARALKVLGYDYDLIVSFLRELCATWVDVAWALVQAGMSPADMLRALLPVMDAEEAYWRVAQVAICDAPPEADFQEVAGVLKLQGLDLEVVLRRLLGPKELRAKARERLGI